MPQFLSPKELAQAVGVSESSLKRWIDDGLLQAVRTPGGHRRIALREAIRYIRHAGLPVVQPQLLGLADLQSVPVGTTDLDAPIIQALKEGLAERARGHVLAHYLGGRSIAALCDGPLSTALREVGDLWRHGPEGIFIEHRAVDLCTQSLEQLRAIMPQPTKDAPTAMGGALEDDPYSLPTLMVATVLGTAGWRAINLGAHLPMPALIAGVKDFRPSLIWISCSTEDAARSHEKEFQKAAALFTSQGRRVIAGGRAWKVPHWDKDSGITPVSSMAEVAAFAEGLRTAQA